MLGQHLLGIYEKAFDPAITWEERFRRAKSLDFDFLEISIDENDDRLARLHWTREDLLSFKTAMHSHALPIRTMCLSAHRRFPFGGSEVNTRYRAREILRRAIHLALELGVRVIQLAGYDVYYEEPSALSPQYFAEGMAWAAEEAERYQMTLAMEIMDTPFMNSITKYMRLKEQVPSPNLMLYPDLGNLSAWNDDAADQLKLGMKDIVAVHIKDTVAPINGENGQFRGVPFGSGCVDFKTCFKTLFQGRYRGPYMIEMWHENGGNDVEAIRSALAFVRAHYDDMLEGRG